MIQYKRCSTCGINKSLADDFVTKSSAKDGKSSQCKACTSKHRKNAYVQKPRKESVPRYCERCEARIPKHIRSGKYCLECKTEVKREKAREYNHECQRKITTGEKIPYNKLKESCNRSDPALFAAYLEANPGYAYMYDPKKYPLPEGVK